MRAQISLRACWFMSVSMTAWSDQTTTGRENLIRSKIPPVQINPELLGSRPARWVADGGLVQLHPGRPYLLLANLLARSANLAALMIGLASAVISPVLPAAT